MAYRLVIPGNMRAMHQCSFFDAIGPDLPCALMLSPISAHDALDCNLNLAIHVHIPQSLTRLGSGSCSFCSYFLPRLHGWHAARQLAGSYLAPPKCRGIMWSTCPPMSGATPRHPLSLMVQRYLSRARMNARKLRHRASLPCFHALLMSAQHCLFSLTVHALTGEASTGVPQDIITPNASAAAPTTPIALRIMSCTFLS